MEKSAGFSEERTEQLIAEGLLRNYPITFLEGTAISFGLGNKNHYHYLVDDISRLVTVRKVPYKHRRDPILVVTEDLPRSYLYLAQRILGDDTKVRVVPERSQIWCERFLAIPPLSRSCQALIEPKVAKLLSNGVPSFEMIHHTGKIYISRQKASKRRFLNEQELIQELQKLKVIPVVLEDLTLSQQKDIFRNAELVVANHGAGLTNLIFSERSPKVLEIHSGQGLEHYEWLCHSLQFPYNSMVVGSPGSNSDIEAPVEEILSWVTSASSSL